jgi:micrococcal nuclease
MKQKNLLPVMLIAFLSLALAHPRYETVKNPVLQHGASSKKKPFSLRPYCLQSPSPFMPALPSGAFWLFHVKHVLDGDTVVLESGKQVRYLGIDAPEFGRDGEPNQFMAVESKRFNYGLVNKTRIRLELDREKEDRYGRLLAYVFLENGDMVNWLIVRKGLARVLAVKPNLKHFHLLLEAQRMAMTEKIGIWSKSPERPEPYYLGSNKSHRFHRPTCPLGKQIAPANRVRFSDSYQASWEGFSPCRKCKP